MPMAIPSVFYKGYSTVGQGLALGSTRKSTRKKKGPARYQKVETTAVGKGEGKESQKIAGPSKKRVGKG